jgi:hypothetical protein
MSSGWRDPVVSPAEPDASDNPGVEEQLHDTRLKGGDAYYRGIVFMAAVQSQSVPGEPPALARCQASTTALVQRHRLSHQGRLPAPELASQYGDRSMTARVLGRTRHV